MNELIKITETNGQRAVSARELHKFLEATERFSNWFERQLQYGFIEDQDYTSVKSFTVVGNGAEKPIEDYALTIDCAKEISMLQRNEKGKQARKYFIEVEKNWKERQKSLTPAEMLLQQCQMLVEQERRLRNVEENQKSIEEKVSIIEAKTKTTPDYFTVVGYATLHEIDVNVKIASSLGRKAAMLCKKRGIPTEEIPDPRFGRVKTYPEAVLDEVFNLSIN